MYIPQSSAAIWPVLMMVAACSASSDGFEKPSTEKVAQAYQSVYQLYLRCNATSWELNNVSKLQPTADPYLFSLDFEVTQPWMVSDRDNCWVTDVTNGYSDYGTTGTSAIQVPSLGRGATRLAMRANSLAFKYPSLGFYRATVNWREGNIAIQRVTTMSYLYMRLRFADDPLGYTPQSNDSIASEAEAIKQNFYRWANGQLSITVGITPTLDLPYPRSHYVTGPCDASNYPEWTGMYWLIDDAFVRASAVGYDPNAYRAHSVRYNGEPGCCCNWGSYPDDPLFRSWIRWDGYEAHEWGHNLGLPDEGAFRSKTSQPLNPDIEYEDANIFSGMHNSDINAFYSVPDLMDLHVLDSASLVRPTSTGTYRIFTHSVEPVGLGTSRKYAIQLQDGSRTLLFEYRHVVPSNADSSCATGLLVFEPASNTLLDVTPRSKSPGVADEADAALQLNRTLTSWDGKWTIKPTAMGGSGDASYIDVRVTFTGR
jgi:hypothetical protein